MTPVVLIATGMKWWLVTSCVYFLDQVIHCRMVVMAPWALTTMKAIGAQVVHQYPTKLAFMWMAQRHPKTKPHGHTDNLLVHMQSKG